MKKIFYFIGGLLIIWLIVIIIGFFSLKTKNPIPSSPVRDQLSDNLILFYNKDIIPNPPATWQEFMELKNSALGTADNIAYAPEILVLLMLEQGVNWPDFNNELGQLALKFYTQFANPNKKVYTWNKDRENSLTEFVQGRIGMVFARESDKEKFSQINLGLARFPVIDIGEKIPELPDLSESEKAVLAEMIESVALGRKSVEEAISEGAKLIFQLKGA